MIKITYNGIEASFTEWAKLTGISRHIIASRINKLGWSVKDALTMSPYITRGKKRTINFSNIDIKNIICEYKEKHNTPADIAKLYDVSKSLICKLLKNNGVSLDNWGRKYYFDEDYFMNIDTPRKAYWLGLFYADACISKNIFSLGLQSKDKYILETLAKDIGYTGNIKDIKENKSLGGRTKKDYFLSKINLCSKKFCKHLEDKGVLRKKTFRLKYPNFIYGDFHKHFIRGLFDGDGYISVKKNNLKTNIGWGIVGQKELLENVSKILNNETHIKTNKVYKVGKNCWLFLISHKMKNIKKLFLRKTRLDDILCIKEWLYKDACLYFDRKKIIFDLVKRD